MPLRGFTRMFENMLSNPNIHILLNVDYRDIQRYIPHKYLIFTGPVDEYFDYRFGKLPYRSLAFQFETHDKEVYQSAPVINYPNDFSYTRVTEFKYLTGQKHHKTTIVYEHSQAEGDPYYPVPRPENAEIYRQYHALAEQQANVHFCGRLATYKYYNMDQVVAQALTLYNKIADRDKPLARSRLTVSMPEVLVGKHNGNGNGNGHSHANGNGNGHSNGNGNGKVESNGNGNGHAHGNGNGEAKELRTKLFSK
jgi:UDP-galactopyranose mutase